MSSETQLGKQATSQKRMLIKKSSRPSLCSTIHHVAPPTPDRRTLHEQVSQSNESFFFRNERRIIKKTTSASKN